MNFKILLPDTFPFATEIPVRIQDINYGNHVGNDAILSILHEARMQFLNSYGFSELNCGGTGLIMTHVAIQFKKELFYGTPLKISIAPQKSSNAGFVLFYKVEFRQNDQYQIAVAAQTEMICYNYDLKKITRIPPVVIEKLNLTEIQ